MPSNSSSLTGRSRTLRRQLLFAFVLSLFLSFVHFSGRIRANGGIGGNNDGRQDVDLDQEFQGAAQLQVKVRPHARLPMEACPRRTSTCPALEVKLFLHDSSQPILLPLHLSTGHRQVVEVAGRKGRPQALYTGAPGYRGRLPSPSVQLR